MPTNRQIASFLERSINKWNYNKAIRLSDNETKTRDYLIEPLLICLDTIKWITIPMNLV